MTPEGSEIVTLRDEEGEWVIPMTGEQAGELRSIRRLSDRLFPLTLPVGILSALVYFDKPSELHFLCWFYAALLAASTSLRVLGSYRFGQIQKSQSVHRYYRPRPQGASPDAL